jgi:hypothetical protein
MKPLSLRCSVPHGLFQSPAETDAIGSTWRVGPSLWKTAD